jgi:hypothetical protein
VRERTEIRSSPPIIETEIEEDDPPEPEGQAGMEAIQTVLGRSVLTETNATSSDSGLIYIPLWNKSLPRLIGELKSLTKSFASTTQLISSSDPTPMSVDNDCALT